MTSLPKKPGQVEQVLTASDRESVTWARLREHYEKRLDTLRKQNDNDLPPDETARVRGRIAEVKKLLALDKELPEIEFKATE